jgi:hypothetical protein
VAAAYYAHYRSQSQPDFHGLRDFYALVGSLKMQPQLSAVQLYRALLRNFGGPAELVKQVRLLVVRQPFGVEARIGFEHRPAHASSWGELYDLC